jgi:hypothetical protein
MRKAHGYSDKALSELEVHTILITVYNSGYYNLSHKAHQITK